MTNFFINIFGNSSFFLRSVITALISAIPVIELRGAIPAGTYGFDLPWYICYIVSVIGNILPVPFILIFIEKIIKKMKGSKHFNKFAEFLEKRAEKNTKKVQRFEFFGLILFVGIPLPVTGAYTGALVAALTGINKKKAFLSICIGVMLSGIIVTLICQGILGGLKSLV